MAEAEGIRNTVALAPHIEKKLTEKRIVALRNATFVSAHWANCFYMWRYIDSYLLNTHSCRFNDRYLPYELMNQLRLIQIGCNAGEDATLVLYQLHDTAVAAIIDRWLQEYARGMLEGVTDSGENSFR